MDKRFSPHQKHVDNLVQVAVCVVIPLAYGCVHMQLCAHPLVCVSVFLCVCGTGVGWGACKPVTAGRHDDGIRGLAV